MKKLFFWAALLGLAPCYAADSPACTQLERNLGLSPGQQLTVDQIKLAESRAKFEGERQLALTGLALLQICGVGLPKDVQRGLDMLTAAAETGNLAAIQALVSYYVGTVGGGLDKQKALEWMQVGSQKGDPEMQGLLGELYLAGELGTKNMEEAERWFLKSAAQGNLRAQIQLGKLYTEQKKYREALPWLKLSAAQGDADSQFMLGQLYYFGNGVDKDAVVAVAWWRTAAEKKHFIAQNNLAMAYFSGQGVPLNEADGFKWLRLSAEQNYPAAMYSVANRYEFGVGVPQDTAEAFKWWKKLADLKDLPAHIRLGWMYMRGTGVARDEAEGIKWFRLAAQQNLSEAHVSLALVYEYGMGVPVDLAIAHEFRMKNRDRTYVSQLIDSCAFIKDGQVNELDSREFRLNGRPWTPEAYLRQSEKYLTANKPNDALCWYQRAADSVYVNGLAPLGNAYLVNGKIPANSKLGIHYLRVGVAKGDVPSRVRLAQVFQSGEHMPKNMMAAYALRFTTKQDLADLNSVLEGYHSSIEEEMTPAQILEAKQLIKEMLVPGQYLIALDRATLR